MTRYPTTTRFRRYEIKVVLDAERVEQVLDHCRSSLFPDRFASAEEGYELTTLYLDTDGYRIHHKLLDGTGTKYRIRRYGSEDVIYLERKTRQGNLVRKRREPRPLTDLALVLAGGLEGEGFVPTFCRTIRDFGLRPALLLTYRRRAWLGPAGSRLTLDDSVAAWQGRGIASLERDGPSAEVTPGTVLELKYDAEMPKEFRDLLDKLALPAGGFSKYGTGLLTSGLLPPKPSTNVPAP